MINLRSDINRNTYNLGSIIMISSVLVLSLLVILGIYFNVVKELMRFLFYLFIFLSMTGLIMIFISIFMGVKSIKNPAKIVNIDEIEPKYRHDYIQFRLKKIRIHIRVLENEGCQTEIYNEMLDEAVTNFKNKKYDESFNVIMRIEKDIVDPKEDDKDHIAERLRDEYSIDVENMSLEDIKEEIRKYRWTKEWIIYYLIIISGWSIVLCDLAIIQYRKSQGIYSTITEFIITLLIIFVGLFVIISSIFYKDKKLTAYSYLKMEYGRKKYESDIPNS